MADIKKYLNLVQATEKCGIPVSTLRKKIREGLLSAYKPGKVLLIEEKELELFIRKSKVEYAV